MKFLEAFKRLWSSGESSEFKIQIPKRREIKTEDYRNFIKKTRLPNCGMTFFEAFELLCSSRIRKTFVSREVIEKPRFVSVVEEVEDEEGYSIEDTLTLLSRVYREERIGRKTLHDIHLGVAVHSILLESGLVGVDPVTKTQIHRFGMPRDWPCHTRTFTYVYTLPQILQSNLIITDDLTAILKFDCSIKYFIVSGPWTDTSRRYVCTHARSRRPIFRYVIGKWEPACSPYIEEEVYFLRKQVRNQLASQIINYLRVKAGFMGPPLLDLPRELQIKIFGLLPPKDIVKVGCVCRALNQIYRDDVLWKKKLIETFGVDWNKEFRDVWFQLNRFW